jgi:hypothetical protein
MVPDLVMVSRVHHVAAAGRQHARRLFLCVLMLVLANGVTRADAPLAPRVAVTENNGVFTVTASFAVSQPMQDVIAVLTDYERIPHYMPDMEVSKVIERTASGTLVEQQAVSKFMLFSKRVHLLLDVREEGGMIRFTDRSGKSFAIYAGSWMVTQHDSLTVIDYQLSAKPTFDVPAFILKRLLGRDSAQLIDRIKAEIIERADRRK